jgi:hypothetical protein
MRRKTYLSLVRGVVARKKGSDFAKLCVSSRRSCNACNDPMVFSISSFAAKYPLHNVRILEVVCMVKAARLMMPATADAGSMVSS